MKYTIREAAEAIGGSLNYNTDRIITGVSTDTRTIKQGELFFALIGDTHDGHNYLKNISECAACVVSRPVPGLPFPAILVKDTLKAMGDLAAFHKQNLKPLTIGITGSVGKTSTKEMTAAFLENLGPCVKTQGNFNNEIGLPLTVFRADETTKTLVTEMGMRGLGQIEYLCNIAKPDIGIITNIGLSHIELLKTQDNIARAKSEILTALPKDGAAFVNWDGRYHKMMKQTCRAQLFTFGANQNADIRPENPSVTEKGIGFSAVTPFGCLDNLFIPSLAEHFMINSLAAIGTALYLGVSPDFIREKLSQFRNAEKRFDIVTSPSGITVIDDTYNANPASMNSAVRTLARLNGKKKIAILGDMLELGDYSEEQHYELGRTAAEQGIDCLYTVGPQARSIARGAADAGMNNIHSYESSAELSEILTADDFAAGDCVLVKGSRSMKMERISILLVNM